MPIPAFFYLKKIQINHQSKTDQWNIIPIFFKSSLIVFCLICWKRPLLGSQTDVKRLYHHIIPNKGCTARLESYC